MARRCIHNDPNLTGPYPRLEAGYDAAKTTNENRKHWAEADGLAPSSQLTPDVRRTLRNRARYECGNNAYAAGLVRTLVNDTVGRGARLQMQTDDERLNRAVEDLWREWAQGADWPLTSRILAGVRFVAGECFGVFRDSKRLARLGLPVSLDLRLIEPDQVADPVGSYLFRTAGDEGIECDDDGEVVAYKVLKFHPGDHRIGAFSMEADRVPAENAIHWFVPDRPGQLRGVTPLAPSLPIFAQLRRFTMATLTAAEVAAMLAGIIEQGENGTQGEYANSDARSYDTVELVRGMLLTLGPGQTAKQFKPEQPTTTYDMFVAAKLRECGRCLNVPYGKMAGDHSRYNYSSGRLDDAPYWADREIERQALEAKAFNPVFYRWLDFAKFALPQLVKYEGKWWQLKHCWHYDAKPTSDPVKDATGDELNLTNATDTLSAIAARDGTTEDALLDARAATVKKFHDRGLEPPPWLVGTPAPVRTTDAEPIIGEDGQPVPAESDPPRERGKAGQPAGESKMAAKAAASGDVQATALNGAQIASLVTIGDKIVTDAYPADGAEAMVKAAFPLMDRELISEFVSKLSEHEAPEPAAAPAKKEEPANA